MRPLIGLGGRRVGASAFKQLPQALEGKEADLYWSEYAEAVLAAGGLPLHIPQSVPLADLAGRLDGILLPGGADVDPAAYGADRMPETQQAEPARDTFELSLLNMAFELDLPVLGICRGAQVVNVHGGGTLHQHVPTHNFLDEAGDLERHPVEIAEGSRLFEIYGSTRKVNSLHHQSIDAVAAGFVPSAMAEDGNVEAIEHETKPVIAVQWHPEMMNTRLTDPIFGWLVDEAKARRVGV